MKNPHAIEKLFYVAVWSFVALATIVAWFPVVPAIVEAMR